MAKNLIPNGRNTAQGQMLKTRTPSYTATGVNTKMKPPGGGSARAKAAGAMLKANTQ